MASHDQEEEQTKSHDDKMSPHLLIVAQKASEFLVAIEQQSKIEGEYTASTDKSVDC